MIWADMPAIGVRKEVKKVEVDALRAKLLVERATEDSYTGPANRIAEETRCDMEEWHESLNYHVSSWSSDCPDAIGCQLTVDLDRGGSPNCNQHTPSGHARRVSFHHEGPGEPFIPSSSYQMVPTNQNLSPTSLSTN